MTEDEAKKKWCPFARQAAKGDQGSAHNRLIVWGENDFANYTPCIASACMAWRWDATPPLEPEAEWQHGVDGHCGLAGAP